MSWDEDQKWEAEWWGDCTNTFGEETKQLTYANRMGLDVTPDEGRWPSYDMQGKSVIDLGGGPVSMLLKCRNLGESLVVDPCQYPDWVYSRYGKAGIAVEVLAAEDFIGPQKRATEVWLYNVLQHTKDPERICNVARESGLFVRIFEWINTPVTIGHPHTLRASDLRKWLDAGHGAKAGTIENLEGENGCVGEAFYGVFAGLWDEEL